MKLVKTYCKYCREEIPVAIWKDSHLYCAIQVKKYNNQLTIHEIKKPLMFKKIYPILKKIIQDNWKTGISTIDIIYKMLGYRSSEVIKSLHYMFKVQKVIFTFEDGQNVWCAS